jgi:hypothetical protein
VSAECSITSSGAALKVNSSFIFIFILILILILIRISQDPELSTPELAGAEMFSRDRRLEPIRGSARPPALERKIRLRPFPLSENHDRTTMLFAAVCTPQ